MRVKAIMLPFDKITCIEVSNSIQEAISLIDKHNLLSLPVVDGKKFIGVLSKQYIYETYFNGESQEKDQFLEKKVKEFMQTSVNVIPDNMRIEEAAAEFIHSKARFIPITNEHGELEGIVTQQAVFKQYQNMFGHRHNSLVIYSHDSRGTMAKICETIAKASGDIRNMLVMHTDVMNLVEIFLRIDAPDFDKVVKSLKKHGFDARDVKYAEKH